MYFKDNSFGCKSYEPVNFIRLCIWGTPLYMYSCSSHCMMQIWGPVARRVKPHKRQVT